MGDLPLSSAGRGMPLWRNARRDRLRKPCCYGAFVVWHEGSFV